MDREGARHLRNTAYSWEVDGGTDKSELTSRWLDCPDNHHVLAQCVQIPYLSESIGLSASGGRGIKAGGFSVNYLLSFCLACPLAQ